MCSPLDAVRQQKVNKVMQSLKRARALVRSREEFGVDGICNFIEGVDGDWLENWTYKPCLTKQKSTK